MNATTFKPLADLTPADLESVYSGRDGKCCCGCSGTHYEREANARQESRGRTISPKMFTKVLRILRDAKEIDEQGNYISTVVGGRLYIAYPTDRAH